MPPSVRSGHGPHGRPDIPRQLSAAAKGIDQPAAVILGDRARRGLLDDTLLIGTTIRV